MHGGLLVLVLRFDVCFVFQKVLDDLGSFVPAGQHQNSVAALFLPIIDVCALFDGSAHALQVPAQRKDKEDLVGLFANHGIFK